MIEAKRAFLFHAFSPIFTYKHTQPKGKGIAKRRSKSHSFIRSLFAFRTRSELLLFLLPSPSLTSSSHPHGAHLQHPPHPQHSRNRLLQTLLLSFLFHPNPFFRILTLHRFNPYLNH